MNRNDAEEDIQEVNAAEASVQDVEAVTAEVSATTIATELAADNDKVDEKDSTTLEFNCVVCGSEFKNSRALSTHQGKMHKGIPQLDEQSDDLKNLLTFSFISEYGKYDVEYTID